MCRLLAYVGPPIALERLISEPEHSLVHQSYAPREMTSGTVNADGFGFAWYDSARQPAPFVYRNILPIWSDTNLDHLGRYVTSECILANVRSATPGQSLDFNNTQPFAAEGVSLLHNGFVDDFRNTLFRLLRENLDADASAVIRGSTDSEHLFGWLVHHMKESSSLAEGLSDGLAALLRLAPEARMTLNFIVSDGRRLVASRLASNTEPPTLYCLARHDRFPDGVLIASEPLFEDEAWQACPEGSIIAVEPDRTVRVDAFAR